MSLETMGTKGKYRNRLAIKDCEYAKTVVLWDVEDFPIPNDLDLEPDSVCEKIKSALGFRGEVSILAYMDGKTCPDKYRDAGITVHVPGDKTARFEKVMCDICLWALDNRAELHRPKNVVVISKNLSIERQLRELLNSLYDTFYNVAWVMPDDFESQEWSVPDANLYWLWKSLLEGGTPIDRSLTDPLRDRQQMPYLWGIDKNCAKYEDATCSICDGLRKLYAVRASF